MKTEKHFSICFLENIYRLPIFYTFLKNTQFLHFLAGIHLKLHFFHFSTSVWNPLRKLTETLKNDHFTPKTKIIISP